MSVFRREFSVDMSPSIDEQTVDEFRHAHELVHGFLRSHCLLTAQNASEAARGVLLSIQGSITRETATRYPEAVRQFLQTASEEIQAIGERASSTLGTKRPREEAQETPSLKPKRAKDAIAQQITHEKVYEGLSDFFHNERQAQEFYFQLSNTALDILEQIVNIWFPSVRISERAHRVSCYTNLFRSISTPNTPINGKLLNDYAAIVTQLSSFEKTHFNSQYIACRLMNLGFFSLIERFYPNETQDSVIKRALCQDMIDMIPPLFQFPSAAHEKKFVHLLVLSGGSTTRLEKLNGLPFDLCACNLSISEKFVPLSDEKLNDIAYIFEKLSQMELRQDLLGSDEGRLRILQRCLDDSRLLDFFNLTDRQWYIFSDSTTKTAVSWFLRTDNQDTLPARCPLCTGFRWTGEEVRQIIEKYGAWTHLLRFWDAEMTGRIEEDLSHIALDSAPREILIRFLGSKPFPDIKAWLEGPVEAPTDMRARVATLSEAQRRDILCRFRGDDVFSLPTPGWRELLHVSEDEARELCTQEEPPAPAEAEEYQRSLQTILDPQDSISLMRILCEGETVDSLIEGLINARVETICHQRTFLTWGGAEALTSACVTQDAPPLCFRDGDRILPIYPGDAFNELLFGTAAVSLRRRLLVIKRSDPNEFSRLMRENSLGKMRTVEGAELFIELARLQRHFQEKLFPSSLDEDDAGPDGGTFRKYLKREYRKECREIGSANLDPNTALYRNSFLFLTLLRLAWESQLSQKGECTTVDIDYGVAFCILSLKDTAKPCPEDNPGIVHFQKWVSGYPRDTITPITPQNANPGGFLRFISAVQNLTDEQYGAVRTASLRLVASHIDEYLSTEEYFEEWEKMVQKEAPGLSIDAAWAIIPITKNYLPSMSFASHKNEPSGTYQATDDPNEFCPQAEVPLWLPYSNFSGAICASFIPHEPERHDGNCGVNSFLLGLHGPTAYEGDHRRNLSEDIVKFRQDVVSYAHEHEVELKEEFGKRAVDEIITNYGSLSTWTGAEVWNIAARVYGREIRLISEETHMGIFRRENSTIVPFDEGDVFLPQGEPKGPPIYLVFFGQVHFAYLEPKPLH